MEGYSPLPQDEVHRLERTPQVPPEMLKYVIRENRIGPPRAEFCKHGVNV
jgi:hypothetical protein